MKSFSSSRAGTRRWMQCLIGPCDDSCGVANLRISRNVRDTFYLPCEREYKTIENANKRDRRPYANKSCSNQKLSLTRENSRPLPS